MNWCHLLINRYNPKKSSSFKTQIPKFIQLFLSESSPYFLHEICRYISVVLGKFHDSDEILNIFKEHSFQISQKSEFILKNSTNSQLVEDIFQLIEENEEIIVPSDPENAYFAGLKTLSEDISHAAFLTESEKSKIFISQRLILLLKNWFFVSAQFF